MLQDVFTNCAAYKAVQTAGAWPRLATFLLLLLAPALKIQPACAQDIRVRGINEQPVQRIQKIAPGPIDINRASLAQLSRVPGITPVYAQRIIAGRPYHSKNQIKTRGIVPAAVYDTAKARIVAHKMK